MEAHRRRQSGQRAQVDARRLDGERLEPDAVGRFEVHLTFASHPRLRPRRHERVTERPVGLQGEGRERPRGDSAPGDPSGKGQGVEKGPGEFEVEVVGVQIGVAQRHQPGVRDAQGGDAAGDRAPRERQAQPIHSHLQDPAPV